MKPKSVSSNKNVSSNRSKNFQWKIRSVSHQEFANFNVADAAAAASAQDEAKTAVEAVVKPRCCSTNASSDKNPSRLAARHRLESHCGPAESRRRLRSGNRADEDLFSRQNEEIKFSCSLERLQNGVNRVRELANFHKSFDINLQNSQNLHFQRRSQVLHENRRRQSHSLVAIRPIWMKQRTWQRLGSPRKLVGKKAWKKNLHQHRQQVHEESQERWSVCRECDLRKTEEFAWESFFFVSREALRCWKSEEWFEPRVNVKKSEIRFKWFVFCQVFLK